MTDTNKLSAILCVDDEAMILDSLREQLHRNFGDDCLYEAAESVAEAWEVIEDLYADGTRILVIVSDWLMPGTRGDEFLIQTYQRFPEIRTIMLTGQADADAISRVQVEAKLYAYLRKPWQEEELVRLVSAVLP